MTLNFPAAIMRQHSPVLEVTHSWRSIKLAYLQMIAFPAPQRDSKLNVMIHQTLAVFMSLV